MSDEATQTARHVVTHADQYNEHPAVITGNWMQLKAAQGHPITAAQMAVLDRIQVTLAAATPTPTPLQVTLDSAAPTVSEAVRQCLARNGGAA